MFRRSQKPDKLTAVFNRVSQALHTNSMTVTYVTNSHFPAVKPLKSLFTAVHSVDAV
jgi:hypothetical protein